MHKGPIGQLGAVGVCPNCSSPNIDWDPKFGVSTCRNCCWGNWVAAYRNAITRYVLGEISDLDLVPDGPLA